MSTTYLAFHVDDILRHLCCNITKYVATYNTKYVAAKKTNHVEIMTKHVAVTCFAIISTFSYLDVEILQRILSLRET